jgi:hypothetical protein
LGRSKLKVGQALKRRIEYGALNLAHYPAVSSWCRAVALQAIQAQGAGRAHARPPDPEHGEPLDKEIRIYLSSAEKQQIEAAGGPGAIGPWLRGWVVWELDRLEVGEAVRSMSSSATVGYVPAG